MKPVSSQMSQRSGHIHVSLRVIINACSFVLPPILWYEVGFTSKLGPMYCCSTPTDLPLVDLKLKRYFGRRSAVWFACQESPCSISNRDRPTSITIQYLTRLARQLFTPPELPTMEPRILEPRIASVPLHRLATSSHPTGCFR